MLLMLACFGVGSYVLTYEVKSLWQMGRKVQSICYFVFAVAAIGWGLYIALQRAKIL